MKEKYKPRIDQAIKNVRQRQIRMVAFKKRFDCWVTDKEGQPDVIRQTTLINVLAGYIRIEDYNSIEGQLKLILGGLK